MYQVKGNSVKKLYRDVSDGGILSTGPVNGLVGPFMSHHAAILVHSLLCTVRSIRSTLWDSSYRYHGDIETIL